MKCGRNMLNLSIIIILIFVIFAMLYRENVFRETFHAPYNGIVQNDVTTNNKILKNDSLWDKIKHFLKILR